MYQGSKDVRKNRTCDGSLQVSPVVLKLRQGLPIERERISRLRARRALHAKVAWCFREVGFGVDRRFLTVLILLHDSPLAEAMNKSRVYILKGESVQRSRKRPYFELAYRDSLRVYGVGELRKSIEVAPGTARRLQLQHREMPEHSECKRHFRINAGCGIELVFEEDIPLRLR